MNFKRNVGNAITLRGKITGEVIAVGQDMMKGIKKTLDPKFVLSRGKFNFWGEETR